MDADSIADFNQEKSSILLAQTPATVEFTSAPGVGIEVSFGEKQNDGQLHSSGQAIEDQRVGFLFIHAASFPSKEIAISSTFKVIASRQPLLVGRTYRIVAPIVALPNEPLIKCGCVRIEK